MTNRLSTKPGPNSGGKTSAFLPTAPRLSSSSSMTGSVRRAKRLTTPTSRSSTSTEQTMPGVIKTVTKDYPLNNKCNFNVPGQNHPGACEAAAAVRLATERGKAGPMIDWLFSHQESLTPQSVEAEVKELAGDYRLRRTSTRACCPTSSATPPTVARSMSPTRRPITSTASRRSTQAAGGSWSRISSTRFSTS